MTPEKKEKEDTKPKTETDDDNKSDDKLETSENIKKTKKKQEKNVIKDEIEESKTDDAEKKEKKTVKKKDEEAEKEEIEIIEEKKKGYVSKAKPVISDDIKNQLKLRREISHRRPVFRRQEGFRYKRLETGWRQPRGGQSKQRRHYQYRSKVVSIGYGGPAKVRHMHPSGFIEVRINNPKQLENIIPETQAARIAHGVGIKKKYDIEKRADELGIRILNRSG